MVSYKVYVDIWIKHVTSTYKDIIHFLMLPPLLQVLTMSCKLMLVGKSESTNRNWSFICFALTKSLWQQIAAATAALLFKYESAKPHDFNYDISKF